MNDIVGSAELVIIKGRVFQFSPLNDLEYSTLDAWIRWRNDTYEEALATVAGAAQIMYLSVKRTDAWTIEQCAEYLDEDSANVVREFWLELNKIDLPDEVGGKPDPDYKRKLYVALAEKYGWTYQEIRLMTPYQQLWSLKDDKPIVFDTEEEYRQWQRTAHK